MDKLKMHSPDLTAANIARIRDLFPGCVTEARGEDGEVKLAVDFDLLRQELSASLVEGPQERFHLDWPGKREALLMANAPIAKTLRPSRDESVAFDTTKNLFIEGDNLDALKLLQETYLGKVKIIYIDPPYNTGNDFIYEDDFAEDAETYKRRSNHIDYEGNRLIANTTSNGRFHSDWLSMIFARLKLARNLLTDDGVIFISIDDGEQDNLKKICNEVFGEENFINTISINMKNVAGASGGGEDKRLKKNVEYIHVYAKSKIDFGGFSNAYDYFPISKLVEEYREEEKSWKYTSVLVDAGQKIDVGTTVDGDGNDIRVFERRNFVIRSVAEIQRTEGLSEADVYNKYAAQIFQTAMPQSSIRPRVMSHVKNIGGAKSDLYSIEYTPRSGRNKGTVYEQFYKGESFRLFAWLRDVAEERDGVLYKKEMRGTYWDYASETKNLSKEGDIEFKNGKKPLAMLRRILEMQPDKDFVALDFFAGSSTTAHAVMQLNAEDGGNRRFIMVQLPEPCAEDSEAYKAGYKTIADLSKERIRRAGKKIAADLINSSVDTGFRVLKVDTSNMADVFYSPDTTTQDDLLSSIDNIKPDRTPKDLLFQVMLDWGVDLALLIENKTISGKDVFFVDTDALAACFDADGGIDDTFIMELAKTKPLRAVFRDAGFKNDAARINAEQIFKQLSPGTEVKTL